MMNQRVQTIEHIVREVKTELLKEFPDATIELEELSDSLVHAFAMYATMPSLTYTTGVLIGHDLLAEPQYCKIHLVAELANGLRGKPIQ